jgi:UDP-N-acetylmuramate dehydrogenase
MMVLMQDAPLRGQLLEQEPLARYTSWRAGGPAERLYIPADIDDLARYLASRPADEAVHWLGLGSNLLVRDGGVRGSVIVTSGALGRLERVGADVIRAEAGVPGAKVARFAVEQGLKGAEFLAGIPGTVGGALAMNAGAFGGETWNIVARVETVDRRGERRTREVDDYRVRYRSVTGPRDEWFVAAHFRLMPGEADDGKGLIKSLLARRGATQPTQLPNAGSVFKNPPSDHAARLIEASGLKGYCIGQACVSELHANFIVNRGGARAADIEQLIHHVHETVRATQGVELETEVRIIGEGAP